MILQVYSQVPSLSQAEVVKHAALQAEVPAIKKLRSDHDHDD